MDNELISVTQAFNGELVDVFVDGALIQVWSKNHLIKTVARAREGRVRQVRAEWATRQRSTEHEPSSSSPPSGSRRRLRERVR